VALTVGELNAILSVDDRAVDPALRRTEDAIRASGQRMGDDAQRTGDEVGEQLGDGIVRGTDGRLRNARGQFVAAGRRAGDAVGDGLTDSAADGADEAVQETESRLGRLQMVAAAAGLAAGAVMMNAFAQAMEQSQITGRLGAQLGATPAEAQRYGRIAGRMYADAVTQDFQSAADAISATMRAGIAPPQATEAQLQSLATKVSDLATTFELDLGQTANAVGQAIKTGLAKDGTEALNIFTRGLQVMGPRADDLMDTFNEYSTIFRQTGIDAKTATGLLSQGMQAGARDTDVIADSLKEFVLITQGGGEAVDDAFKKIGLSGKEMQTAFSEGGPEARAALDKVFDGLRGVGSESDRQAIALALFGTKAEDTQRALFALDPSKATSALGEVGGAADKMGDSLRDNAGANVEAFKRRAMQELVDFLGNQAIPALMKLFRFVEEHSTAFKVAGLAITAVLVPALVLMGVTAMTAAGRVMWGWVTAGAAAVKGAAIQVGAALRTAGAWVAMQLRAVGAFLAMAASATANALRVAAAWVAAGVRMTVTFLATVLRVAAVTVGQFALMAARAVAWAAVMAAQWLVAMGPVGWVIATIVGLTALIIANWDSVKKYTSAAWRWVWDKVKGAVRGVVTAVMMLAQVPGLVLGYFSRMKDAAVRKAGELVTWMRNWPASISRAVGSLGGLLVSKGADIVRGLWSGIKSMGGWLKDTLIGWAKSVIPGPIAKALGIASPSKVTAKQGQWIARGLVQGLTGSSKQVRAASTKLADIVRDALSPGKKRSKALGRIATGTKQLLTLANREARLAGRMKSATKMLANQIKARDKLAADVRKGVLEGANITGQDTGGWPQTADTILAGLQADRKAAEQFAKNLATLRKKGVRSDLIAQIAQAGVEQGSSAAAALANATGGQIKAINKEQGALVTAAGQAGATAGNAMYGAGIRAGQGLVRGLKAQQKAIETQMMRIAQSMSKAIKKALGIKSPSRVMAQVGAYTAEGLRQGIEGGRRAVNRSMASLVETPAPGSWDMASARARASASQRIVLEMHSSGRGEDDYLVERMRRGIRKKGGGDVDLVLAGRRSR